MNVCEIVSVMFFICSETNGHEPIKSNGVAVAKYKQRDLNHGVSTGRATRDRYRFGIMREFGADTRLHLFDNGSIHSQHIGQ